MQNVTQVGQYQRMQSIGLSRKKMADLYYERIDSATLIEEMHQTLSRLQNFLNEYEVRHNNSKNFTISYTVQSAVTCYCTLIEASSFADAEKKAFLAHENCVKKGYRMLGSEPLMGIYDDLKICLDPLAFRCKHTLCIPVVSGSADDPNLRYFPSVEALSILGLGGYEILPELWNRLLKEFKRLELEAAGPPRYISLIAPYAGAHYTPDNYFHKCMIPIIRRKDVL